MDKTDCLATRVQNEFPDALSVHRLDMSTSGLQVFARGEEMHRRLSLLFRERGVNKCYIAMLAGRVAITSGDVDLPLASDWPNRPRQKVDFEIGKPSLTRYPCWHMMRSPAPAASNWNR
jgi:tRNA pseudouridine32 synthase/23S rRNA pseudouridine746 synthase